MLCKNYLSNMVFSFFLFHLFFLNLLAIISESFYVTLMCSFSIQRVFSYDVTMIFNLPENRLPASPTHFSLKAFRRHFTYCILCYMTKSSPPEEILGKGVLEICNKFRGEHSLFFGLFLMYLWSSKLLCLVKPQDPNKWYSIISDNYYQ